MLYNVALRSFLTNKTTVSAVKLAAVWLIGLVLGGFIGANTSFDVASHFFKVSAVEISFLGAMLVLLMPLLLAVFLDSFFTADSVLAVVFLKAMVFAIVAVDCVYSWGSAGWLVIRLLMFSEFLGMPVLLWVCYRILCVNLSKKHIIFAFFLMLLIAFVDIVAVSPFLCSLL